MKQEDYLQFRGELELYVSFRPAKLCLKKKRSRDGGRTDDAGRKKGGERGGKEGKRVGTASKLQLLHG